jgi:fatty acid desaturase
MPVWRIDGRSYDLTTFVDRHPGGDRLIRDTSGSDITYLVQSYHYGWSREHLDCLVRDFEVPDETVWPLIQWDPQVAPLQRDLARVGVHVVRDKTPWNGVVYYTVLGMIYAWTLLTWIRSPTTGCAVVFGVLGWVWAGMIQHEGSHNALSRKAWVNNLARYAILPWAPPGDWFRRHIIQHHQYTNTELDLDVQTTGAIRHHPQSAWTLLHVGQMVYVSLGSVLLPLIYSPGVVTVVQVGICYVHWWYHTDLVVTLLPFAVFGVLFVSITQLNHIQPECFSSVLEAHPATFVRHQVASSVDYHHGNALVACLSIFLNYQTYHHLFPGMSHFQLHKKKDRIDKVLAAHGLSARILSIPGVLYGYWMYMARLGLPTKP